MQARSKPASAAPISPAQGQPTWHQPSSAEPQLQQPHHQNAAHQPHSSPILVSLDSQQNHTEPVQERADHGEDVISCGQDPPQQPPSLASREQCSSASSIAASAAKTDVRPYLEQPVPGLPAEAAASQQDPATVTQLSVLTPAVPAPPTTLLLPTASTQPTAACIQDASNRSSASQPCSSKPQAGFPGLERGPSPPADDQAARPAPKAEQMLPGGMRPATVPSDPAAPHTERKGPGHHAAGSGKKDAFSMLLSSSGRTGAAASAKPTGSPGYAHLPSTDVIMMWHCMQMGQTMQHSILHAATQDCLMSCLTCLPEEVSLSPMEGNPDTSLATLGDWDIPADCLQSKHTNMRDSGGVLAGWLGTWHPCITAY